VQELYYDGNRQDGRVGNLLTLAKNSGVSTLVADKKKLDRLSGGVRHQGVVAVGKSIGLKSGCIKFVELLDEPLILILDGIEDPSNLGSCLRTGAAAGADAVVLPRNRGCGLTPTALRVSQGGGTSLPIFQEGNWGPFLRALKEQGTWLVGLDEHADEEIYDVDLLGPLAIIAGSEESGLRRLTRRQCDRCVRIPAMSGFRSLNVSMAAGIALFEARRQRSKN